MDWLMWCILAWAVFTGGAITGSRFRELGLAERERRVARQRAELHELHVLDEQRGNSVRS